MQSFTVGGIKTFPFPTCPLQLCSAVSALTYHGICMNVGSFGVDVYSAQFFSGLSETPCLLIPLVHLGRRALSMLTLLLSGASCFLSLLLSILDGESHDLKAIVLFLFVCFPLVNFYKNEAIDASSFAAPPAVTMSLALLGKLCILASIFVSVLYSIELFPTMVR